jgi:hypothetical protein
MNRAIPNFFEALQRNKQTIFLFSLVLGVGIFVRFFQLDQYFTHTDDLGIIEFIFKGQSVHDIFFLPRNLTNAPFQYLFTYFLISPAQSYRELLFWARLPSCVAGCLALGVLAFCCRKDEKNSLAKGFFALTLVACSLDNVAFAKQAHSYAIGVLAVAILLLLLMRKGAASFFSKRDAWITALVLAFASHMQYQTLLFVPAFYLALWTAQEKDPGTRYALLRNFVLSAALLLILVLPMWSFFLRTRYFDYGRNITWALGSAREYTLDWDVSRNLWGQFVYAIQFFLKNLFVVFESKIAFIPESAPFFRFFITSFYGCFLLGAGAFFASADRRTRALGVFLGVTLLTWWGMAAVRHFPFGPSRHTLILLPLFAVTVAEGAWVFFEFVASLVGKKFPRFSPAGMLSGLGVIVLILFSVHLREFFEERKNPVSEKEIVRVLKAFGVDEVFYDRRGYHLEYFPDFRDFYKGLGELPPTEIKTFSFITRYPVTSVTSRCEQYREMHRAMKREEAREGGKASPKVFLRPCKDFQVVYEKKVESDVSEGFSRKLKANILFNRLYFYVLSVDPEKKKIAEQFKGAS